MMNEVDLSKDLISKSKLYDEAVRLSGPFTGDGWDNWGVYNLIMRQPPVDAVPVVHGRWVHEQRYGDSGGWVWRCSVCRREAISPIISALKYCHSCGAKMDAKEDDNA